MDTTTYLLCLICLLLCFVASAVEREMGGIAFLTMLFFLAIKLAHYFFTK